MTGILAPDKLNVVSNNYQDPEDVAYGQWAVSEKYDAHDGNLVTSYINGPDAFAQMAEDFETAKNDQHAIYLTGFETSPTTPMGGSTLADLLSAAVKRNVMVRGLFNGDGVRRKALYQFGQDLGMKDNMPLRNYIKSIGGEAELDDHCGITGAHHQKIVVVQGECGLIAYCGGIDLHDARANAGSWHDVHCRLVGPAAYDLFKTFADRWADVVGSKLIEPMEQAAVGGNVTTYNVQIGLTYPELYNYLPYAKTGRRDAIKMIKNAIRRTATFIYVEDQFMVCHASEFVDELKTRLAAPSFKYLVMLTLSNDRANWSLGHQAEYRRKLLLEDLRAVAPDKVVACVRKDLYVHAKTWVFDDKFAIIGSANCNNRGYYSDGEAVAGIADKNPGGTRLWFAHRLRMALWMKHLDLSEKDVLNVDDALVAKWKTGTAKIDTLDTTVPAGQEHSDLKWAILDPPM